MTCPVCGSEKIFLKYPSNLASAGKNYLVTDGRFGMHGNVFQCKNCDLGWINDAAVAAETISSYGSDDLDGVYEKERENRKKTAAALVEKIKKIKPDGRLLDIGCYSGVFLEVAQEHDYEVFGIEVSPKALALAGQKIRGDLRQGMAEEVLAQFPDNYFDVITLFDVIEHLREPGGVLKLIKTKLKDDGLLAFSTPNFSSFISKLQGKNWHALLPHHLYYFSNNNLEMLLNQNGLRLEKIGSIGRHFTLNYLVGQIGGLNLPFAKFLIGTINFFKLGKTVVPINLFDQLLIFAKKK